MVWLMVTTYPAPATSRYGPVKVMSPGLATACWYLRDKGFCERRDIFIVQYIQFKFGPVFFFFKSFFFEKLLPLLHLGALLKVCTGLYRT